MTASSFAALPFMRDCQSQRPKRVCPRIRQHSSPAPHRRRRYRHDKAPGLHPWHVGQPPKRCYCETREIYAPDDVVAYEGPHWLYFPRLQGFKPVLFTKRIKPCPECQPTALTDCAIPTKAWSQDCKLTIFRQVVDPKIFWPDIRRKWHHPQWL